jgi:epoxyqueuosine reductase
MFKQNIIKEKALELHYEDCGIIGINEVDDYLEKLNQRINLFPETQRKLEDNKRFVNLNKHHAWAKSIIICVRKYGKYYIPDHLKGLIAKYYLVDSRTNEQSPDYKASIEFEKFLKSLGIQTVCERKFGITALRWAAIKAGLGIIRQNNFFYTNKSGSWVYLEAWLIDKALELKQEYENKNCPNSCNKCIQSCPTKSLNAPYSMNRSSCISCLTTWDAGNSIDNSHNQNTGKWIFGCDVCQDVCPFNQNKWEVNEYFPELNELSEYISVEKIIDMDYIFLQDVMAKKFWYINKDEVYKWKTNALNAMFNNYNESYLPYINKACNDQSYNVQIVAKRIKKIIEINNDVRANGT